MPALVQESEAQPVYDIAGKLELPSEEYVYFANYSGEPVIGFVDYKKRGFVAGLTHTQTVLLGQEISEKTGMAWKPLSLQVTYDKAHSDYGFNGMLRNYWIYNSEVISRDDWIMPNPSVEEKNGKLAYKGDKRKAKINTGNVFDTMVQAGLLKKPENKVWGGIVYFDNEGLSSVRSDCDTDGERFDIRTGWPSNGSSAGLAAFIRADKEAQIEAPKKIEIAEAEYKELIAKAQRYDVMKEEFERLKKHF